MPMPPLLLNMPLPMMIIAAFTAATLFATLLDFVRWLPSHADYFTHVIC